MYVPKNVYFYTLMKNLPVNKQKYCEIYTRRFAPNFFLAYK